MSELIVMNEKRYYKFLDDKQEWVIRDRTNRRNEFRVGRNKRYAEKIVDKLNELAEENKVLNSIKKFAEDHGINIFYIDTAFRNCWNENADLVTKIRKQEDEIRYWKNKYDDAVETFEIDEATATKIRELEKENEQLRQKVDFYKYFQKDARELEKENEKLRKQIQNYEELIANSYVGEEERLDGWVGRYVIWEDELQEYKNKNEMIE